MEHCPHQLWHRAAIFSALTAAEMLRLVTFRMSTWEFSSSSPTLGTLPHVSVTFRLYARGTTWDVPHQEMCVCWGPGSKWNPKPVLLLPDYHCNTFMGIFVLCFWLTLLNSWYGRLCSNSSSGTTKWIVIEFCEILREIVEPFWFRSKSDIHNAHIARRPVHIAARKCTVHRFTHHPTRQSKKRSYKDLLIVSLGTRSLDCLHRAPERGVGLLF